MAGNDRTGGTGGTLTTTLYILRFFPRTLFPILRKFVVKEKRASHPPPPCHPTLLEMILYQYWNYPSE
jgi:hypothetical protein